MPVALPADTVADNEEISRCPWCGGEAAGVRVCLEAVLTAHVADALRSPWRGDRGEPDPLGLQAECDVCSKPFLVALKVLMRPDAREMRLIPVRTEADLRWTVGEGYRRGRPL